MTTKTLPVLPLRDIVVFPDMVAPLFVGRDKSVRALEMVDESDNEIMLVAQKDPSTDDPGADDLHPVLGLSSLHLAAGGFGQGTWADQKHVVRLKAQRGL